MDTFIQLAASTGIGAIVGTVLQRWISDRLHTSMQHDYSQRLEALRAELNSRVQHIEHVNELSRLQISLFFEHRRSAFCKILTTIAEVNRAWDLGTSPDGEYGSVPSDAYRSIEGTYYDGLLFLDSDCVLAIDLVIDYYRSSLPDNGYTVDPDDAGRARSAIDYLFPRIAELFRAKIESGDGADVVRDIALFGAITVVNKYTFHEIGLPVDGALKIQCSDSVGVAVKRAANNCAALVAKLRETVGYLDRSDGLFYELRSRAVAYLRVLNGA
jgi:hypothetical protein